MKSDGSAWDLRRWWRSAAFAWEGVRDVYRAQANFRMEVWAALLALGLSWWLGVALLPVILCCALVLSLELVNTALEAVVDLCSPQVHPLAKLAKDAVAGAVLLAAFAALLVGLLTILPALWQRVLG